MEVPSIKSQQKFVEQCEKKYKTLEDGETYYVLPLVWWRSWLKASDPSKLGKIDNSSLYNEKTHGLKQTAQEDVDYILKNKFCFDSFNEWYGVSPIISGQAVTNAQGTVVVDMHPARFIIHVKKVTANPSDSPLPATETEPLSTDSTSSEDAPQKIKTLKDESSETETVPKTLELVISRYKNLRELKSEIAKLLKRPFGGLKLAFKSSESSDEEGYTQLNEIDESVMNSIIGDALPKSGLITWYVNAELCKVVQKRLSAVHKFSPLNPKIGQRLDVKLNDIWYEGVIVNISPPDNETLPLSINPLAVSAVKSLSDNPVDSISSSQVGNTSIEKIIPEKTLTIHFMSFSSKQDMEYQSSSEDLQPAYSKMPDWRTQLRVGERVELNKKVFGTSSGWIEAEVKKIDRTGVQLKRTSATSSKSEEEGGSNLANFMNKMIRMIPARLSNRRSSADSNRNPTRPILEEIKSEVGRLTGFHNKTTSTSQSSDKLKQTDWSIPGHGLVLLSVYTQATGYSLGKSFRDVVVDLGSEDIAAEGTHIQQKKKANMFGSKNTEARPVAHGIVGLRNLGNTCYMNSTLQCLFATKSITNYFMAGEYKQDLNRKNPLGYGGKIAIAFAKLIEEVECDKFNVVAPSNFKTVFGNIFQSFQGYGQQDSHEFMLLLIDALHEDLNRIKNKPYVDATDEAGKSESELAKLEWNNFLLRNDSILVDHLYGLLKSHLVCPTCNNEATKFDTFSTWVVPIPVNDTIYVQIIFLPLQSRYVKVMKTETPNGKLVEVHTETVGDTEDQDEALEARAIRYVMEVNGEVNGLAVAKLVAEKANVCIDNVLVTDLRSNRPDKKIFDPLEGVHGKIDMSYRTEVELCVYELEPIDDKLLSALKTAQRQKFEAEQAKLALVKSNQTQKLKQTTTPDKLKGGLQLPGGNYPVEIDAAHQISVERKEIALEKTEEKILNVPNNSSKPATLAIVHGEEVTAGNEVEEDDPIVYLCVQYKAATTYYGKLWRVSDIIRFDETNTSNLDIYCMVWRRIRFMFEYEKLAEEAEKALLKDEKTNLVNKYEVSEAEIMVLNKFFSLTYTREDLPADNDLFKRSSSYSGDLIEAKISKFGLSSLCEGIKVECPSRWGYSPSLDSSNAALNVGFVMLDSSVNNMHREVNKDLNLYDCMEAFRSTETLGADDEWYCNKCQKHVQATKKMDIYRTGDVLIIALKRFRGERFRREKISQAVDFPLKGLDLSEFLQDKEQQNTLFDLYAVSYHMGGMAGGHYIAKAKHNGSWYEMNDSSVSKTSGSKDNIVNSNAYVLYYRRRDALEASVLEEEEEEEEEDAESIGETKDSSKEQEMSL